MPVIGFMSASTTPRIETEQLPAFRQGLAGKAAACGLASLILLPGDVRILGLPHRFVAQAQSSGSTFTILWSWLLPTQNVTGVVELSTNTVRMLVSDGIRY